MIPAIAVMMAENEVHEYMTQPARSPLISMQIKPLFLFLSSSSNDRGYDWCSGKVFFSRLAISPTTLAQLVEFQWSSVNTTELPAIYLSIPPPTAVGLEIPKFRKNWVHHIFSCLYFPQLPEQSMWFGVICGYSINFCLTRIILMF